MRKIFVFFVFTLATNVLWAQQFAIPAGAVLIESTEFKNDGITYIIEQRYRLASGETMYVYYDVDGASSVTIQRLEQTPLAIGNEIKISGMPGYREFNFGNDDRKLVQFLKIMKLGWQRNYIGYVKTPSLSDRIFRGISSWRSEFILLLDLYDETWILEHRQYSGRDLVSNDKTTFYRVDAFRDW